MIQEEDSPTTIVNIIPSTTFHTMDGKQVAREQGDTGRYITYAHELYQRELASAWY